MMRVKLAKSFESENDQVSMVKKHKFWTISQISEE